MALFGFGKKKEQSSKAPEVAPVEKAQEVKPMEKKEEPVIVPEEKIDPAVAEEYFQKFKSLAKEDNAEAFVYLQKAADLWHKEAVKRVISLYRSGHCLECIGRPAIKVVAKEWKTPEKAVTYGLEAEQHGVDVAWELMYAYLETDNYEQALHWAKISDSRSGKTEAVQRLDKKSRELASEGMDRFKQNDYQQALALFEKAGELGLSGAQYNCALMYNKGEGTAKNYEKSLYWFEKAAQQGNTKAQGECGIMYAKGEGTAVDKTKALYWLEKAVGSPDKWKSSGLIYEGYDARRDVHILGEKGYSKKAELKDWEVIVWDDSIPNGTPVKMETFFRSNMFIITLLAKA